MAVKNQELLKKLVTQICDDGIQNIRFEFLDTNAVARSKTIPARHLEKIARTGIFFPVALFASDPHFDTSVESHLSKSYFTADMVFYPDLSTYTILPWVKHTARIFISGSSIDNGDHVLIDPRVILQNQLKALKGKGFSIFSSFEYEFWLLDKETQKAVMIDYNGFATLRLAKYQTFIDEVAGNLYMAGVDINCMETEYGKGLFEMTVEPSFGIQAADIAATFRTGVKEMATMHGYIASLMSKPYSNVEAASGHLNHSLWSLDGKKSELGDPTRPFGLSETGEHWIAGLLKHAPALSFLQAPTLNCLDRIKADLFYPFNATWGTSNRTVAIRLKKKGAHGIYIENRMGTSAGNPYIGLAATIAAGLDGIKRKLSLPTPVPFNKRMTDYDMEDVDDIEDIVPPGTKELPRDFESAIKTLENDDVMVEALGHEFIDSLASIRRLEKKKVGDDKYAWARMEYFEYI